MEWTPFRGLRLAERFFIATSLVLSVCGWAQSADEIHAIHRPPRVVITDPKDIKHPLKSRPVESDVVVEEDEPILEYDTTQTFQEIDGYGASLTDSAVLAINSLKGGSRQALLNDLFNPASGLNINYLRVPIGATDFSQSAYSYLDLPTGEEDPTLSRFSMKKADATLTLLHEILGINPNLKIMLSPWSPPAWMKTNQKLEGGSLRPDRFSTFARYLMKTLRRYEHEGLPVSMLSVQNEPYFANDQYPSMSMEADDQIRFIHEFLTPLLKESNSEVKVLGLDHNYDLRDNADHIFSSLKDELGGIAYHCYGGDYSLMKGSAAPLYQTECSGVAWADDPGTMDFWLGGQIIGAGLLGAKLTLGWNLALDKSHGPAYGYCHDCRGLADVDADAQTYKLNTELIAMAHAGKYWRRGARRIATRDYGDPGFSYIAYANPSSELILVVENKTDQSRAFQFRDRIKTLNRIDVPAHGAATVILPP